ncbi:aldo/keto reductase [Sphingobium sp. sgz301303]|uniref:aldo/keto reductase n=1 Tax=Sphingobium sp. sgz301304 TaxID=3341828 RepID=UPI0035A58523
MATLNVGSFTVSAIGLGCMSLSHAYLPRPDAAAAERLLRLAVNLALSDRLKALARQAARTSAQLCLAGLLAKGDHVVPIPGTTSPAHLDENLATLALDWPADLIAAIDALFPFDAGSDPRYADAGQYRKLSWRGARLIRGIAIPRHASFSTAVLKISKLWHFSG